MPAIVPERGCCWRDELLLYVSTDCNDGIFCRYRSNVSDAVDCAEWDIDYVAWDGFLGCAVVVEHHFALANDDELGVVDGMQRDGRRPYGLDGLVRGYLLSRWERTAQQAPAFGSIG
jgi:hypothetical protein